jgi:phosphatidylinositol glycan class W
VSVLLVLLGSLLPTSKAVSVARRRDKEAFVTGLEGSDVSEIVYLTLLPSILCVVYMCVQCVLVSVFNRDRHRQQSLHLLRDKNAKNRGNMSVSASSWITLLLSLIEYIVLLVPELAQTTSFGGWRQMSPKHAVIIAVVVMCVVVGASLFGSRFREQEKTILVSHKLSSDEFEPSVVRGGEGEEDMARMQQMNIIKDAVSMHRAQVMLLTCLSILAVDFRAFPRRYAKTEFYGTSLMDAGVGSIVLCSSYVQGVNQMRSPRYKAKGVNDSLGSLMRVIVLIVLGIGRPIVVSIMGYQVHEGEYGKHWNFFLTLAVLRLCITNIPRSTSPLALGAFIMAMHQYGLTRLGLAALVNSQERGESFFQQNKEGILSLGGYLALHFLGVWCAKFYVWLSSFGRSKMLKNLNVNAMQASFVAMLWAVYLASDAYIEKTSRRSCNATFVLWMLAINLQAVLINSFCLNIVSKVLGAYGKARMGRTQSRSTTTRSNASPFIPPLLNAMNRGMLYVFLLSNIVTGLVNASVDTLAASDKSARYILALYMALVYVVTRAIFD